MCVFMCVFERVCVMCLCVCSNEVFSSVRFVCLRVCESVCICVCLNEVFSCVRCVYVRVCMCVCVYVYV